MKIPVGEKLFVESDDTQFMVKQYSGKLDKDGKEISKTLGYFSSLKQTMKFLVRMEILKSAATTFKQLLADIDRIEGRIDKLLRT